MLARPRELRAADVEPAAAAIARAFAWHEPWGAWVLPDRHERESTLRRLIAEDLEERFLPHGECWTIAAVCTTLWIPPPSHPGGAVFSARRSEREYRAFGERAEALREADRLLDSLKPEGEHWYLDTIATDPAYRRRGLGARLLDHDLERRDRDGERCALDTHTRENVDFYRRRGFELVAEARLPADGPDLFVMERQPGARRPTSGDDGE